MRGGEGDFQSGQDMVLALGIHSCGVCLQFIALLVKQEGASLHDLQLCDFTCCKQTFHDIQKSLGIPGSFLLEHDQGVCFIQVGQRNAQLPGDVQFKGLLPGSALFAVALAQCCHLLLFAKSPQRQFDTPGQFGLTQIAEAAIIEIINGEAGVARDPAVANSLVSAGLGIAGRQFAVARGVFDGQRQQVGKLYAVTPIEMNMFKFLRLRCGHSQGGSGHNAQEEVGDAIHFHVLGTWIADDEGIIIVVV